MMTLSGMNNYVETVKRVNQGITDAEVDSILRGLMGIAERYPDDEPIDFVHLADTLEDNRVEKLVDLGSGFYLVDTETGEMKDGSTRDPEGLPCPEPVAHEVFSTHEWADIQGAIADDLESVTLADLRDTEELAEYCSRGTDKAWHTKETNYEALMEFLGVLSEKDLILAKVLIELVQYRNFAMTSTRALSEKSGIKQSNIKRHLDHLKSANVLRIVSTDMKHRGDRMIEINPTYVFKGDHAKREQYRQQWMESTVTRKSSIPTLWEQVNAALEAADCPF